MFIGELNNNPLIFVIGAKKVPNRSDNKESDLIIIETINLLYKEYLLQQK